MPSCYVERGTEWRKLTEKRYYSFFVTLELRIISLSHIYRDTFPPQTQRKFFLAKLLSTQKKTNKMMMITTREMTAYKRTCKQTTKTINLKCEDFSLCRAVSCVSLTVPFDVSLNDRCIRTRICSNDAHISPIFKQGTYSRFSLFVPF